ncbi:MAG: hypothetical protein IJO59_04445 [Clostridia bacterium]|nr:hypothetical protein [Clostridia bacterium]
MKRFLGLDIGTTSLKAAVFDEHGTRLGLTHKEYTLDTDPVTGFIEFDPEQYVVMCKDAIARLRAQCGEITALSVDTQGETLILADENGTPLCPAIVWLDNRATAEAEEIDKAFGRQRVYEVTGQPEITATWPAAKLLWVKKHRPDVFAKTKRIFLLEDWILYRLSGEFVTEPTIQSSTIYFDVTRKTWWPEMLAFIGITADQLPRLEKSATVIGEYEGIVVTTGALDQIAGTIGVGVTDESRISEMTGTIMAICVMSDTLPPFNPDSIVPCHLHAVDGKYCLLLWSSTAGMALKWFREQFAPDLSFAELDELAAKVTAGCDGLTMLPHFCGSTMPRYNPAATASFTGLTLSHTKGHFARAIMEAVAFTLRQDLEYTNASRDCEVRITGGGASGKLWPQIKADVTGRTLTTVCESETACIGSAILAMVGVGAYESIHQAVEATVKLKGTFAPNGADYEAAYRRYCETENTLIG